MHQKVVLEVKSINLVGTIKTHWSNLRIKTLKPLTQDEDGKLIKLAQTVISYLQYQNPWPFKPANKSRRVNIKFAWTVKREGLDFWEHAHLPEGVNKYEEWIDNVP